MLPHLNILFTFLHIYNTTGTLENRGEKSQILRGKNLQRKNASHFAGLYYCYTYGNMYNEKKLREIADFPERPILHWYIGIFYFFSFGV